MAPVILHAGSCYSRTLRPGRFFRLHHSPLPSGENNPSLEVANAAHDAQISRVRAVDL